MTARTVTIRAVGDIAPIGRIAQALQSRGAATVFGDVRDVLRGAEIAFGNLEMPISSDPQRAAAFPAVCVEFWTPAETAAALADAGFDVLNLANNHMMDWGPDALAETLARLQAAGIQTVGAGANLDAARRPVLFERNGLKVGFLGYGISGAWNATGARPGIAPIDRALLREDIAALRPQVDLLVVSLHRGVLSDYPNPEDRALARELVGLGVDLVLGHGPHVLQGVEVHGRGAIAHSLGNFIIDMSSGNIENRVALAEQRESIILDATLAPGEPPALSWRPIVIEDAGRVALAAGEAAERIDARVRQLSDGLERMKGRALWEHAGQRTVEHELRVLLFQGRAAGWGSVARRLRKLRGRHFRLLLGYLSARLRAVFGRSARIERSVE